MTTIVHAVLLELLGNQGEPSAGAGPIAIGQSVETVRERLGPGTVSRECTDADEARSLCDRLLSYTDGRAVAIVRFPARGTVSSIVVRFGAPLMGIARLARGAGAIGAWTWAGGRIDRFAPQSVYGWSVASYATGRNCSADFEIPDISTTIQCAPGSARVGLFSIAEH